MFPLKLMIQVCFKLEHVTVDLPSPKSCKRDVVVMYTLNLTCLTTQFPIPSLKYLYGAEKLGLQLFLTTRKNKTILRQVKILSTTPALQDTVLVQANSTNGRIKKQNKNVTENLLINDIDASTDILINYPQYLTVLYTLRV